MGRHTQEKEFEKWFSVFPFDYIFYVTGSELKTAHELVINEESPFDQEWTEKVCTLVGNKSDDPSILIIPSQYTFDYVSEIPGVIAHEYGHVMTADEVTQVYNNDTQMGVKNYGVNITDYIKGWVKIIYDEHFANKWAYTTYQEYTLNKWFFNYGNETIESQWKNISNDAIIRRSIEQYFYVELVMEIRLEEVYPNNRLPESFWLNIEQIRQLNLELNPQDIIIAFAWLTIPESHDIILQDIEGQ